MNTGYLMGSVKINDAHTIRYFHCARAGEGPWYCAADVVQALGQPVHSTSTTLAKIPDHLKTKFLINDVPHLAVDGVALLEIIMRSRAPRAEVMREWARWWTAQKMETYRP